MIPVRGLYGLLDTSLCTWRSHRNLCDALLAAGARVLQLRHKTASDDELRHIAEQLAPRCRAAGATLLVNDRLSVAAELGLGLHLGQDDGAPEQARRLLGPGAVIGWSTHDLAQVAAAPGRGVDYVGFGPVFSAAHKHVAPDDRRPVDAARGLELLRRAVERSQLPVVAIGGITSDRLAGVLATGVAAVAMMGALNAADDVEAAATSVQAAFAARETARR